MSSPIAGADVIPLKTVRDERGFLFEVLRSDAPHFTRFGQAYVTAALPGVVKAWHFHARQTDYLCLVAGQALFGLFDAREGSATAGRSQRITVGANRPHLIVVPPMVYHGFKCLGETPCLVLNLPTELYDYDDPDELRLPHDDPSIPFDWGR